MRCEGERDPYDYHSTQHTKGNTMSFILDEGDGGGGGPRTIGGWFEAPARSLQDAQF